MLYISKIIDKILSKSLLIFTNSFFDYQLPNYSIIIVFLYKYTMSIFGIFILLLVWF